ncbi:MAG: hypothetical protein ACI8SA_002648, partial [Dokdonia sp.]
KPWLYCYPTIKKTDKNDSSFWFLNIHLFAVKFIYG